MTITNQAMVIIKTSLDSTRINPLNPNPTKWSNTLKHFVGKSRQIVLSVFDYFVGLVLIGLRNNAFFLV